MRIDIIAAIPKLLESPFDHSIIQRAKDKGLLEIVVHDLRDYGVGPHKQIDDYQYGGGAGMVLMIEPLHNCILKLQAQRDYQEIIYMSPDGDILDQPMANRLSLHKNLIIICGHYKGIDERLRDHVVTKNISIGKYVISGGELAAAILTDAIGRLLPGVLNDASSALFDSFQDDMISPPIYTRPETYNGWTVPKVLLSGHDKEIENWRQDQSLERTKDNSSR